MKKNIPLLPEEYKSDKFRHANGTKYRIWTDEELQWCADLREKGFSTAEIAISVDRKLETVRIKIKRLEKKANTYNSKHVEEKYEVNRQFVEHIKPKSILDVYCGVNSFYKNEYPKLKIISNDKDANVKADYNLDALQFLCKMYLDDMKFDLVDLDPFGSASECLDLAIKMAKKGLIVTLGEMGHKRWKRLDYVSRHYDIHSLEDFTTETIISKIVHAGKKNKKLLVPHFTREWKNIGRVYFEIQPMKIEYISKQDIEGDNDL